LLGPGTKLTIVDDIPVDDRKLIDLGDIAMERGQRIRGHVRDAQGNAVAGARVEIGRGSDWHANTSRLRQWFEGTYEATTEVDGSYAFDGIGQPEFFRVRPLIFAVHDSIGASPVQSLPEGDVTIDFVLLGSGTIDGFVDGAQNRHCFVDAIAPGEPRRARWTRVRAGSFRFDNVPSGEYVISLSGMGDEPAVTEKAVVLAGQPTKVKLVMTSSTVRLTIKVPRGREKDLRFERVEGDSGKPVILSSMLMDGQITFSDVHPGEYRASFDGMTWTSITVLPADPPAQTVVLAS